ncbi:CaiB/BaiF CoA transferase family protein [Reichenbachiella versicolor]|uniref:CaiB/BaiF CoA transferase family protein n=1 Tax=Reichenbachiella versicolor TaxID=1821036 RepID=UPI000D6E7754|nr:CaiB/BaiF CoA-transferase family protein [Reichenbachiella versicolor]
MSKKLPLEGITVLEFAQFMAGPSAGLKMADLGANVIKIERPGSGEAGRKIAIKNLFIGPDSLVFHTINRNKRSYSANLKDPNDLAKIKEMIKQADVMTHNFRPGVMEKIGLDYETVKQINSGIIYGDVLGYGDKGPWAKKPGQDLLIQSLSGICYLTGNKDDNPTPMGLAASDMFTGGHLVQGILAALIKKQKTGEGSRVSVSLLESTMDMQFESLTAYVNNGKKMSNRAAKGNAQAFLGAPYGIYETADSHVAIAMKPLSELADAMEVSLPVAFQSVESWFGSRDAIMEWLQETFTSKTTEEWISKLETKQIWCGPVYNYDQILNHEGYQVLKMDQEVETSDGDKVKTTRCPIRIDGSRIFSRKSAPKTGEDNEAIEKEFNLN